ncbi:MAG: glycoside hydrolase, partial [Ruminococcaceae bacterium]|nr:glycoside hydrolase [Oscillospiraceae bacterium]
KTGEPILRNLEYNYPHLGYEKINDQFMLGENILVAPVIKKGQKIRTVILPSGEWESYKGEIFEGGKTVEIPVTLKDIPYFIKKQ